jgi:hypothetical protein
MPPRAQARGVGTEEERQAPRGRKEVEADAWVPKEIAAALDDC